MLYNSGMLNQIWNQNHVHIMSSDKIWKFCQSKNLTITSSNPQKCKFRLGVVLWAAKISQYTKNHLYKSLSLLDRFIYINMYILQGISWKVSKKGHKKFLSRWLISLGSITYMQMIYLLGLTCPYMTTSYYLGF